MTDAEYDALENDIAAWHLSDSTLPLHEWLGLTEQEYAEQVMECPVESVERTA